MTKVGWVLGVAGGERHCLGVGWLVDSLPTPQLFV